MEKIKADSNLNRYMEVNNTNFRDQPLLKIRAHPKEHSETQHQLKILQTMQRKANSLRISYLNRCFQRL
jgi:hypothetical protein